MKSRGAVAACGARATRAGGFPEGRLAWVGLEKPRDPGGVWVQSQRTPASPPGALESSSPGSLIFFC